MWIGPFRVGFLPPSNFKDWTVYGYKEHTGRELAQVGYGSIPLSASTAHDVLLQREQELVDLKQWDSELTIEPALEVPIGPMNGSIFNFIGHEDHYTFREWWAIALLDDISYVQIIFHASAMDPSAVSRMRKILASVRPDEDPDARPAGPGFMRYRAGRISIDIPQRLKPPLGYSFGSADGKVSLDVNFYEKPANWSYPDGEILDLQIESSKVRGTPVSMLRFDIIRNVPDPGSRWSYRHAQIVYDDGVTLHVDGNGPAEQAVVLDRAFREFTANVNRQE
jgi:hypothetical protein